MKKLIFLSTLLAISGCSKPNDKDGVEGAAKDTASYSSVELAKPATSDGYSGFWSNCNDKSLSKDKVSEGCTNLDNFLWAFSGNEIIIYDVTDAKITQECATRCYASDVAAINTTYVARGEFEETEQRISVTFVDSNDEKNFPMCTMHWNKVDSIDEGLKRWEFKDGNCGLSHVTFFPWVKRYQGNVNVAD